MSNDSPTELRPVPDVALEFNASRPPQELKIEVAKASVTSARASYERQMHNTWETASGAAMALGREVAARQKDEDAKSEALFSAGRKADRHQRAVLAAQFAASTNETDHAKAMQEKWTREGAKVMQESSALFRQEKAVQPQVERAFAVAENIAANPQEVKDLNRTANERMLTVMRNLASPEFYRERAAGTTDLETVDNLGGKIQELEVEMAGLQDELKDSKYNARVTKALQAQIDSLHEQADDLTSQRDATWNRITASVRRKFGVVDNPDGTQQIVAGSEWDRAIKQWQQAHERNITVPVILDGKGQSVDVEQTIGPDIVRGLAENLYADFKPEERLMTAAQLEEAAKEPTAKLAEPEPPPAPEPTVTTIVENESLPPPPPEKFVPGGKPPELTTEQQQAAQALVEGYSKMLAGTPDEMKATLAGTFEFYQKQGWSPDVINQITADFFRDVAYRAMTINAERPMEVVFVQKLLAAWPKSATNNLETYIKAEVEKRKATGAASPPPPEQMPKAKIEDADLPPFLRRT